MAEYRIDLNEIDDREALHDLLEQVLPLPDYYGRNLDALWDVLSTWSAPLCIEVTHTELLKRHLADYADALLELLHDAQRENDVITLNIS